MTANYVLVWAFSNSKLYLLICGSTENNQLLININFLTHLIPVQFSSAISLGYGTVVLEIGGARLLFAQSPLSKHSPLQEIENLKYLKENCKLYTYMHSLKL